ncbi:methylenetetrahydrofolate dehydrogenase (NADP+)/methenyltetrahydrofolate cyclohydrolase [Aminobacter lissarensis]|uniref:Bifunctional protein FolD n=1 Tax=Aminobacter carboxidus TaxID=376165 RepID=A0A8E1WLJ0_9HYPH|nr:bifunctional methylenetetrahydrofolate dehydrogenase/methenyltetrahydrofolate cyclohydrolase FolD [Aminobacter lissarensis]MBB6469377.1 methylenetetrahydrofolate dehydrogenase (NADP+)/methenyltetrahydrofolate cyclohydrolase [Aminobacter lissarensis]
MIQSSLLNRQTPTVIDGRKTAARVLSDVKARAIGLKARADVVPGIAVVIVGEDPASKVYVASKARTAIDCGFHSVTYPFVESTTESAILDLIAQLNTDPLIHGILVQLPLPPHVDAGKIIQAISPEKDVDGFNFLNVGRVGTGAIATAFVPCTPKGAMLLLTDFAGKDLSGLHAVVVGRSNIVGKPMANLLLAANATVTIAHSRTADLASLCRSADILVAAVGQPELIRGDWIKPGAVVIDVGINRVERAGNGKALVGDVAFDEASVVAGAITPVPGGVGPMTIAMLMINTLGAAELLCI